MTLTVSEISQIKFYLGFNVLGVGAVPYIGITAIFEQVIQPYLLSGASTTCTQTIAASDTPTPVTLTLASAVGFAAMNRIVIDVDGRQEIVTVQSVAGSTVTALLSKAHSGIYPVTVEGGESLVRGILNKIRAIDEQLFESSGDAGIKKVDEIEFFGGAREKSSFDALTSQAAYWRKQLCMLLFGVGRISQLCGSGSTRFEIY